MMMVIHHNSCVDNHKLDDDLQGKMVEKVGLEEVDKQAGVEEEEQMDDEQEDSVLTFQLVVLLAFYRTSPVFLPLVFLLLFSPDSQLYPGNLICVEHFAHVGTSEYILSTLWEALDIHRCSGTKFYVFLPVPYNDHI